MKNKLITQNQIFNFQGKEFTVILINDNPHWIAKEICTELDIKNHSDAIGKLKDNTQKVKLSYEECKQIGLTELQNLQIGTKGIALLTEAGIYKLAFKSGKPNAEEFTDWISEDVLPKIRQTGKYDVVENKIQQIEDIKERKLTLSLYSLEQVLKVNPNDMLAVINYKQTKQQLDTYKQQQQLEKTRKEIQTLKNNINDIKNDTDLIKKQQVYICNRTNFNERVKILSNKYFGRDIQKTYNKLFKTMLLLGSFDVYVHRKHEWEALNAERAKEGKKPYKASTLKQKINYLDVIDKFNKWELCSEAYKTIETEMAG